MPRTTTQRGYGTEHQRERARWAPLVATETIACARCHHPILNGQPWDLGHTDDRTTWQGPEHRRCNRGDGARKATTVRRRRHAARRAMYARW